MSKTVIQVENLSKAYQLGQFGTGTISRDIERWWITHIMGKEDPFLKIGETNDRSKKGESDIVWSLKDINFEVKEGEAVGIIGKNGAGKSTLLKLLSRVTGPTTGRIKVRGRIASLLEVGTGFHPELTGRENIYLNGAILGMRRHEISRVLDQIIDFSGIERYVDTPVKRYSSGMYVRLAFAVAAHLESEILIVDEVLAVGDAEFQKKCLGKMGEVSKGDGRTILFVSHNMAAVQVLCQRVIVLKSGLVSFDGPPRSGIDYYLSSGEETNLQKKEWCESNAPGDERAKILSVEAYPTKGETINFNSGVSIFFMIKSNIEKKLIDISFNVKSHDHTLLFHHGNYIASADTLCKGIYKILVKIPPFILNEGTYLVDVWMGYYNSEKIGNRVENVISFDIKSSDIDHIIKPLPGLLRPKLEYQIEYEG